MADAIQQLCNFMIDSIIWIDVSDTVAFRTEKNLIWSWDEEYKLTMWKIIMWKSCKSSVKVPATVRMSFIEAEETEFWDVWDKRDMWHFYFRILLGKQLLPHSLTTQKTIFFAIHKREFFHKNIFSLFYIDMVCLSQGSTEGSWP